MNARRKQRGVVLLTLMLVIMAAGSYVLLRALNVAALAPGYDESKTRAALTEAKLALIGYAVSYPERTTDPNSGPGRLPCPDYRFFDIPADPVLGSTDSCSLGAGTETGLFPWYTIDANELRDASGARLWYAVSDVYRSNAAGMVNSDTRDATTPMVVDSSTDEIVAVIIAPGPSLGSQSRGASAAEIYDPSNYLEGENATRGDNAFTAAGSGEFNDEIVVITRRELMAAVQQRVLRDAVVALNEFHADPDDIPATTGDEAYPWLRAFGDPDTIAAPTPGSESATLLNQGHLALHQIGQTFDANFNFTWNVTPPEGTLVQTEGDDPPNNYPSLVCVYWNACVNTIHSRPGPTVVSGIAGTNWSQGTCTWVALDDITCTAIETFSAGGDDFSRTYTISITGIDPTLVSPTASADRERTFNLNAENLPAGATITLQLSDVLNPATANSPQGTTILNLTAGDAVVSFDLNNVPFYLAPYDHTDPNAPRSPGALPQWFSANDWHRMLLVAYADAERPGDLSASCSAGVDCVTLQWDRAGALADVALNDIAGVVVIAGSDLSSARPSVNIGDYFEGENATFDDIFAKASGSAGFNDQTSILDPND